MDKPTVGTLVLRAIYSHRLAVVAKRAGFTLASQEYRDDYHRFIRKARAQKYHNEK